jgi:hypothetical protein
MNALAGLNCATGLRSAAILADAGVLCPAGRRGTRRGCTAARADSRAVWRYDENRKQA